MSPPLTSRTPGVRAAKAEAEAKKARVFISYKRNALDEEVALEVYRAFEKKHDVFIDQTMPVGTHWAERIEAELRNSDFLVVFLSEQSVNSQMVKGEIATAYRLAQESNGRPIILPVRLAYREPFQYPLSAYLDPINWAFWENSKDTERIIKDLAQAISGGELSIRTKVTKDEIVKRSELQEGGASEFSEPSPDAQPNVGRLKPIQNPYRPADFKSDFYMVRDSDLFAQRLIESPSATFTIKGPEQRGKSSLLFRTLDAAIKKGKRVAFLDFQLLDRKLLNDADRFYKEFCSWISDEIEVDDRTEDFWNNKQLNSRRCTNYMGKHLLRALNDITLVLAIDEVETIAETDFSLEFYTMLRNWSERRGFPQYAEWERLDMVFVLSTEPYRLIHTPDRSPFNVGDPIELEDFSLPQIARLNELHNSPLKPDQVERLSALLCGHPYLIRRALYMLASRVLTVADLFEKAADAYGPFGDHLRYHLFELRNKESLIRELKQVLYNHKTLDASASHLLRGAGLIRGGENDVKLRCPLYEEFFLKHLQETSNA